MTLLDLSVLLLLGGAAMVMGTSVNEFPVEFSCENLDFYDGKHLVFVGDSQTHFQYLSFVYSLRHCVEVSVRQVPTISEHNWDSWEEMFVGTNALLSPFEACDCYRNPLGRDLTTIYTNRYYRDPHRNVSVTYINYGWNKDYSTGREQEKTIWSNSTEGVWSHTLPDTIKYRVANLGVKPDILLLNVGLFPNHFHNKTYADEVVAVAEAIPNIQFIWKTTTYRSGDRGNPTLMKRTREAFNIWNVDTDMCSRAGGGCLNISWTKILPYDAWNKRDHTHFRAYVYNWMNRQMTSYLVNKESVPNVYEKYAKS